MRKILRPAFLGILILLCGGIIFDPFWWYRLVHQGQYLSLDLWLEPVNYTISLLWTIFFTLVTIYAVLVLSKTGVPDKLVSGSKTFWDDWVVGRKRWRIYVVILFVIATGVWTAGPRSHDEQAWQKTIKESQESLEKSKRELQKLGKDSSDKNKPPLSEPT